jgi:hypothetical protein
LVALATLLQASGTVGERAAGERTGLAKRGLQGLDGCGAEHPPCSQDTRCTWRLRLIAPILDKTWEDADMRHGRKSSATPCNGFKEHGALTRASHVTQDSGVRPANEPEPEAMT